MAKFTLNLAPVELSGETKILVGRQPYDRDRLIELRRDFRETHVFRRDGTDDVIVDVPVVEGQKPIGNIQESVDLTKEPKLWGPLLSAALLRAFTGVRDLYSDHPVSVVGSVTRGLVRHPQLPEWLQRRTLMSFETRSIYSGTSRVFGIVCEARLKNFLLGSCADLLALGVSLIGRYVQVELEQRDPRLMKRRALVGRVRAVVGERLHLDDHAEGYESVHASVAFLEGRNETLDDCVRSILGQEAPQVLHDAENMASAFHSGPGRKAQIEDVLKYLREKASLVAAPGIQFSVGSLFSSDGKTFPPTDVLKKPILVFDPSGLRKDEWNERGLKTNGPYDQRTFSPKRLKIAVVCQAKHEGQVDAFVAKFLDGMPNALSGPNHVARYGDGFLRRFALEKPSVTFFTSPSAKAEDYLVASRAALTRSTDEGFKWDLALVQVEEEFKSTDGDQNPYYATKSVFLKRDIPVQSVRRETMAQPDNQLVFSLNHMSLAIYAKLGGTPWVLASQQTVAHELVVGLGSHSVANSRLGAQDRYVGITTVFSSDGRYLLSDKTSVVPYDGYAEALYETLKRSITAVRKQDNWRSTDKVRLVFHMFKPPKDIEAEAIKRTVDDLELDNVTFAFLHVAPSHPFLIFDNLQGGIGKWDPKKGVLGPQRGLHLKISDSESLLVFSGASELKQVDDGMPRPCLLKLHRLSTFTDMTYLARQAFEFSGHSWRMLSPEPFPITIRYSDLIAERLAGLSEVSGWDPEAVRFGQIGHTLWFL